MAAPGTTNVHPEAYDPLMPSLRYATKIGLYLALTLSFASPVAAECVQIGKPLSDAKQLQLAIKAILKRDDRMPPLKFLFTGTVIESNRSLLPGVDVVTMNVDRVWVGDVQVSTILVIFPGEGFYGLLRGVPYLVSIDDAVVSDTPLIDSPGARIPAGAIQVATWGCGNGPVRIDNTARGDLRKLGPSHAPLP